MGHDRFAHYLDQHSNGVLAIALVNNVILRHEITLKTAKMFNPIYYESVIKPLNAHITAVANFADKKQMVAWSKGEIFFHDAYKQETIQN